jgi:thymidine kinase
MDIKLHTRGNIQIIFGPMFSGKTTELLRRVQRYSIAKRKCLLIKYDKDQRYSIDGVSTHDKYCIACPLLKFIVLMNYMNRKVMAAKSCDQLCQAEADARGYDIIGIDEGQFVCFITTRLLDFLHLLCYSVSGPRGLQREHGQHGQDRYYCCLGWHVPA